MAGSGRAIAGAAVFVVVALAVFLVLRGHVGGSPGAAPDTRPAVGGGPGTPGAPPGSPPASSARATSAAATRAAPPAHGNPLAGAAAYLAGRTGTVLAAVYDVRTGQSWRLGDGPAQDEASIVKLDILQALLARRGGPLPAADRALARSMIEDSDNDAATALWYEAGGAAGIGAYNARAGLAGTTPSPCVSCAGFPWPGWGLTTTVPQDQIALLKQLVVPGPHPLLSAAQRSYALSLMENVTADQAWGVSGGVPAGVTVALKNGWLPLTGADSDWQVNSVGWVSGDGRDYLIAVLAAGNPTERYGIDTIDGLSALVWSAMR